MTKTTLAAVLLALATPLNADPIDDVIRKHRLTPEQAADVRRWNDPAYRPAPAPKARTRAPAVPAAVYRPDRRDWWMYPHRVRGPLLLHSYSPHGR